MFDQEGYEHYVRQRIRLELKLEEIGDFRGSKEIELQLRFAQVRLLAKIKQVFYHAAQEVDALCTVLNASCGGK